MTTFSIVLVIATFLCSLVTGLLYTFALIVMPGIGELDDGEYIRAFQKMDGIIQNNHPLFLLVWVGSILTLLAAAGLGMQQVAGSDRILLIAATGIYICCVQLPTFRFNIPLNNKLQSFHVASMNEDEQHTARAAFEPNWNRWNIIRTGFACLVTVLLLILLSQQ
ncbi:MAG: DUF1772 domain-containing protein [Planctomycetota bacterium]